MTVSFGWTAGWRETGRFDRKIFTEELNLKEQQIMSKRSIKSSLNGLVFCITGEDWCYFCLYCRRRNAIKFWQEDLLEWTALLSSTHFDLYLVAHLEIIFFLEFFYLLFQMRNIFAFAINFLFSLLSKWRGILRSIFGASLSRDHISSGVALIVEL